MKKCLHPFVVVLALVAFGNAPYALAQAGEETQTEEATEVETKPEGEVPVGPDEADANDGRGSSVEMSPEELQKLSSRLDTLKQKSKIFRFGISIGPRVLIEDRELLRRRQASIAPGDSTLQFEDVDKVEINLAGVVAAYPFVKTEIPFIENLGFLAKVNLADFGPDSYIENKVIEGGIGLSYSFHPSFALTVTYERVSGRRLRSQFEEGAQVVVQGVVQTELNL